MSGEKKHPLCGVRRILEILETVVYDHVANVVCGISGEETNLRKLPAERSEYAPENLSFLAAALVGKGHVEIAHSDASQPSVKQVDQLAQCDSDGTRKGTR